MDIGMIGLGRMGGNMAQRLLQGGHRVVVYDPRPEAVAGLAGLGAAGAASVTELAEMLVPPRAVWVMAPPGAPTEQTIAALAAALSAGDTVIDGGNANYKESMRRGQALAERGIDFLDVGTSGGIWGLRDGYCLMVGGPRQVFERLEPLFQTLAAGPDRGYSYVGVSGAGHFVKMVHNGIEYGLMQAYAEGFELLGAKEEFNLDLAQIAQTWRHGSVVRSWLLELAAAALKEDPHLAGLQAYVEDSGEGRWTVQEAVDLAVPLPVITAALQQRFRSRQDQPLSSKLLAALRQQFGGHAVRRAEE
ncbi:MAG: decarboxylating 6-phosphogluconate dehydrogenase [Dehalococcoidia bacterium]|nr:decarboxylating 6-phosphogluconate dehydrogenase [Dehalococcoidia bacterium]MSQ17939.1 decarboxylating 6-phosphogluconate dehydrogenase [Dehalococcoidia bacterium]